MKVKLKLTGIGNEIDFKDTDYDRCLPIRSARYGRDTR